MTPHDTGSGHVATPTRGRECPDRSEPVPVGGTPRSIRRRGTRPGRTVPRVRLPSVPGPSDLLAAVEGIRDGVTETLALLPRIGSAAGRLDGLLDRVDG